MIQSRSLQLTVMLLVITACSSNVRAEDKPVIVAISATLGRPSTFVIAPRNGPDRERVVSSSTLIQKTLLPALLTRAPVQLDLVPDTNVIKRVNLFSLGDYPSTTNRFYGDYTVSRIATQRNSSGTDEHLEVTLKKIGDNEEFGSAYNVYDPLLQQLLIAAFIWMENPPGKKPVPIDVQFGDKEITTVTLGEKYQR
jgi:hypothetical protein